MTPPITIRRRWLPNHDKPAARVWTRSIFNTDRPWWWSCRACLGIAFGSARTQPAAQAAGLAHLATHTETRCKTR